MYRQWQEYSAGYDVALAVVGNKAQGDEDVAFLREHVGDDLLTWLGYEPTVRAMEQGRAFGLADLSAGTTTALDVLRDALDARDKDWDMYTRQAAEFHLRNADAWGNAAAGTNLANQVDPDFTLGPRALSVTIS